MEQCRKCKKQTEEFYWQWVNKTSIICKECWKEYRIQYNTKDSKARVRYNRKNPKAKQLYKQSLISNS